ncbi:MAG: hypothetical protein R3Y09_14065, partial [Clostridia bacterium]
MKRFLTLLLTALMVITFSATALAADSATGSVLRLESLVGTITITNSAGRTMTASENMRLLNGYSITTSNSSYAYVSLDDSKAIKLDALTTCTIRQQGSNLELLVESGSIFFNVSAPLSDTETMSVRTSTTVTGIRGTSGTVWSNGSDQSRTRIHSGSVTVTTVETTAISNSGAIDTNTDALKTTTISAGQEGIATHDTSSGTTEIVIISTTEADYSGFELQAIANEDGLLEKILETSETSLTEEVISQSEIRLAEEQAVQDVQVASVAIEQEAQTTQDTAMETIIETTTDTDTDTDTDADTDTD